MFPYLPAHKQAIIGRDELVVMQHHDNRNTMFFECPNNGRRELMVNDMEMCYIWFRFFDEGFKLFLCFPVPNNLCGDLDLGPE